MAGPRRPGPTARCMWTTATAALVLSTVVSAQLPYIPTTILLPPPNKKGDPVDTAYIFTPRSDDDNTLELLSLNLSSLTTSVLSTPPTITGAFTPTIFANGTLGIFTGDCSSQSDGSLWTWSPESGSSSTTNSPTWHPHPQPSLAPFHLGGSISFSLQLSPVVSPPTIYLFGGMCPFTNLSSPDIDIPPESQQFSATYSNSMFRLPLSPSSPSSSSTSEKGGYLSPPGPPIPNAGALTQQNGWVLLGGHTQEAFINMSTAAVWSLPEETWSFIPISGGGKVDSRSGHTTVLSEDGTKLVVYGGWVGDVGQRAEPEVVVVDLGLGGLGGWTWRDTEIKGGDDGEGGRYGHGAAVLPGDVMVVYGGWGIGEANEGGGGRRRKRGEGVEGLRFLDLKRMEWVDGYVLPESGSSGGGQGDGRGGNSGGDTDDGQPEGDESNKKTQIGLGVGIGVGLLILFSVIGFIFYRRRRQQTRSRNDALRDLSQGINGSLPRGIISDDNDDEMLEREHGLMFPWTAASAREWYIGGDDPYSQGRKSLVAYEGLRGGVRKTGGGSLYMPPPPPSSSKNARGLYQPTNKPTAYEFAPGGGGAGRSNLISPIYEADEDDEGDLGQQPRHTIGHLSPEKPQDSSEDDDPFLTPTTATTPLGGLFPPPSTHSSRGGNSPSPERKPQQQAQDPEVQNWQNDVDVADAVLTARIGRCRSGTSQTPPRLYPGQQGSVNRSPTRGAQGQDSPTHLDDGQRTGSNLSEASAFSFIPGAERQQLRVNTATANNNGDTKPGSSGSGGSSSAPTFSTARSSFPALQSEGPGLLLGGGQTPTQTQQQQTQATNENYDDGQGGYEIYNYDGYKDEEDADYVYVPGSPSKSKPPQRRSWLGSIRRVFEKGTPESSATGGSREDLNLADKLESGTGVDTGMGVVRTGTLQRRKQNRQSWGGEETQDGEWDIERAVEQRLVQVMFTVPKEKLRVVNAEIEQEGEVGEVVREGERGWDDSGSGGGGGGGYYDTWDDAGPPTTPTQQKEKGKGKLPEIELLRPPQMEDDNGDDDRDRKRESIAGSIITTHTMGISPSTSLRQAEIKTEGLHTAEAVRYERLEGNSGVSPSPTTMTPERVPVMRPKKSRTRVLEMVESIESKSSRSSLRGSEEVETPKKGGN
ncbi:hypothetical protein B0T21DRAFT_387163 [Apiosordaria backusii]|uniref:Uncharacterized protein n=1 Tax=Apiosordaria backusii TaxID=314023 RepID=A0AA40AA84_9PEZI|nr:hypothetical protein B0T21DRAFT_387163 [Apiosordaria backusii]